MFITADQIIAHCVGDYLLQSDWQAAEKTKKSTAAAIHAITYTFPFLFFTRRWEALTFICVSHFIIDRWRLARHVCWLKNFIAPRYIEMIGETDQVNKMVRNLPWSECSVTGYPPGEPVWLTVWLMIIVDNIIHIIINASVLKIFVN